MSIVTPYENLLTKITNEGIHKSGRTGTGTTSLFAQQMRFDLSESFPLITTKKVFTKGIICELLWFLKGDNVVAHLKDQGVHIWDEWELEDGTIGTGYGVQWRSWPDYDGGSIDQITRVVEQIKDNPNSRRLIVSAWNPAQVEDMALPPCHTLFLFYVADGKLSCQLYQRSAHMFLGVPFNIASYSLLTHMIAQQTGLSVGEFIWTGGDCHIYDNHQEQVFEQLSREPRPYPQLELTKAEDLFSYDLEDFKFVGYDPHPTIKAPVAV